MKWYFGTNESGSVGDGALHARLAVLSALKNTRLQPHLITTGFRNEFADWMERHGVRVLDASQPLAAAIERAHAAGTYDRKYAGHWLRCEVPLFEQEDEFVLYTDFDVVFLKGPRLRDVRPPIFACAPEFRPDRWNYVNTGVMVMNIPGLRETLPTFLSHIETEIGKATGIYHDQFAFNIFFRGQWTRLDPILNWKPYWGVSDQAVCLHFQGAKFHTVRAVLDGALTYDNEFTRTIGSLVATFSQGYAWAIRATLAAAGGDDLPERSWIKELLRDLEANPVPVPAEVVNLNFLDFEFFRDAH